MKIFLENREEREIWRGIIKHPYYQVSNLGRIKRLAGTPKCHKDRILKPFIRARYAYIALCEDSKAISSPIHRLVLEAFIGPQPKGYDPDHINNRRLDNRSSNLQWITIQKNRGHPGEKNGSSKLKGGEVWLIKRLLFHKIKVKDYMARIFKVHPCTIGRIKTGSKWKHIT